MWQTLATNTGHKEQGVTWGGQEDSQQGTTLARVRDLKGEQIERAKGGGEEQGVGSGSVEALRRPDGEDYEPRQTALRGLPTEGTGEPWLPT